RLALDARRISLCELARIHLQPSDSGILRAVLLPPAIAYGLWLFANAAALLGGLAALFVLFPGFSQKCVGIVYLLLLPLALGNLDVGQSNPLVVGQLMFAIAAVRVERWNIAALCVAIPTFFKIYPLAVGMLICVIAPRRFVWRLLVALLFLA